LAKGKRWKWDYFLNMDVYEFHFTLAHSIDKKKLKYEIQKGLNSNVTQL
jgi:hypothetical protein